MSRRGFAGAAESQDARGAVVSTCIACGASIGRGKSYCRAHVPVSRTAKARGNGTDRSRFRRAVLAAAGNRCQAVTDGRRCHITDASKLEADHLRALADGGGNDPSNGVALCTFHHRLLTKAGVMSYTTDPGARERRLLRVQSA